MGRPASTSRPGREVAPAVGACPRKDAGGWGRVVAGVTTSPALQLVEVGGCCAVNSPGVSPVVTRLGIFLCICDVRISCSVLISGLFFPFLE